MKRMNEDTMQAIAFVGDALGPLFRFDPAGELTRSSYDALRNLDLSEAAHDWPFVDDEVDSAKSALALVAKGLSNGVDDDLIWEYRRLFIGPARKAAPPWGSVYTDRESVIFGKSTLDLRQWMRETGIVKQEGDGEPEDHIGTLLLLMSWVARNKPERLDEFLREHLLTWVPHFLETMDDATEHPFFKGLAQLAALSLEGIRQERGLEVDVPRFYR